MFVDLVPIILTLCLQFPFCKMLYQLSGSPVHLIFLTPKIEFTAAMPPRDIIGALTKVTDVEIPSSYWRSQLSTQTGGVVDLSHMQSKMSPRFVNQLVQGDTSLQLFEKFLTAGFVDFLVQTTVVSNNVIF